jgi:transcriptional regulator with XRE-family HTH domain
MRYAEKLYKQMVLRGLNQQKLARLSSISDSEISRILNGKSNPSLEYGRRLARALGISLDYLADDALDADPHAGSAANPAALGEIADAVGALGPKQARRLLETASDLGYEVAMRRLLGLEARPIVEVGDRPPVSKPIKAEKTGTG